MQSNVFDISKKTVSAVLSDQLALLILPAIIYMLCATYFAMWQYKN